MRPQLLLCLGLALTASIAAAADHIVSQKGKQFSQTEITIQPGDTIVFKNDDDTAHNVFTASAPMKFNLAVQKAGTETRHTFTEPGEAEIRCAIHPKMKLKVTVKK